MFDRFFVLDMLQGKLGHGKPLLPLPWRCSGHPFVGKRVLRRFANVVGTSAAADTDANVGVVSSLVRTFQLERLRG